MDNGNITLSALDNQQTITTPLAVNASSKWFYGSGLDLIVGCGAWSIPLLLIAYYFASSQPQGVSVAFYALALVFNYPHYMATIYRAYRTPEDFAKYKIFTLHTTLLIGLLVVLGHLSYQLLAIVFTIYLTWSPFHYTGQNFGIALMFARRNGVTTSIKIRRAFYLAFLSSYAMFFLAFHSAPASEQLVLTLGIPLKAASMLWLVLFWVFAASITYSLYDFVKQTSIKAMTAPLVMLSTQIIWFVIPSAITLFAKTDFLQTPATVAVLAVMHSAQYLWITSYYARREAQAANDEDNNQPARKWSFVTYFFILVVGGIALFIPGPWLASRVLNIDFGVSFLVFTALVNIHHFILDGAIWKLRDGRIAALLLNTARTETGAKARLQFKGFTNWIAGSSGSSRFVKVGAALSLLFIAGLDQLKFYHGVKGSDAASLNFAGQLNPVDASLQLKLARSNESNGKKDEARTALEEAVRINPNYRLAHESLAKLLIESGEYEKAYAHYQQMFARFTPDVNSLVNSGILAAQLKKQDEAVKSFQQALTLDNNQPNAHLYLAQIFSSRQQLKQAIPHYEQFLVLIVDGAKTSGAQSSPLPVLNAALQLGAAYQIEGDNEKALTIFTKASELAEKAGEQHLLSIALIQMAEIKAHTGKQAEALSHFQRALNRENSENSEELAVNWFKFGKFLQGSQASPNLATACFIKAQNLLEAGKNSDNPESKDFAEILKNELKEAESSLKPGASASIKNSLDSNLQEALTLKF